MTPTERKLASALLRMAADKFSNHGCNDFHLVRDAKLTPEEIAEVKATLTRNEYPEPIGDGPFLCDWLLMDWLAEKVLEE